MQTLASLLRSIENLIPDYADQKLRKRLEETERKSQAEAMEKNLQMARRALVKALDGVYGDEARADADSLCGSTPLAALDPEYTLQAAEHVQAVRHAAAMGRDVRQIGFVPRIYHSGVDAKRLTHEYLWGEFGEPEYDDREFG